MISVDNPFPKNTGAGEVVTDLQKHYNVTLGRFDSEQLPSYLLLALSLTVRDRLMERWRETRLQELRGNPKRVFYLSLEFLLGRTLSNAVLNLEMEKEISQALQAYGTSLEELRQNELDAGLGNGGLGRLAACFLDSCATLALPVTGYGIRYEYGMFHQRIDYPPKPESPTAASGAVAGAGGGA